MQFQVYTSSSEAQGLTCTCSWSSPAAAMALEEAQTSASWSRGWEAYDIISPTMQPCKDGPSQHISPRNPLGTLPTFCFSNCLLNDNGSQSQDWQVTPHDHTVPVAANSSANQRISTTFSSLSLYLYLIIQQFLPVPICIRPASISCPAFLLWPCL